MSQSTSLCWFCANCSPLRCEWVMASNGTVPAYVTVSEVKTLSFDTWRREVRTRCKKDVRVITECERYRPGREGQIG